MDEHIIFYVDLLGSKAVIDSSNDVQIERLTTLLHVLAKTRGSAQRTEQDGDDGRAIQIRPEITTFSDHAVISFPLEHLNDEMALVAMMSAESMISALARAALELDMLIRGGATIGALHHRDGVVLGGAMVEAWELESRTAIYPRVVISHALNSYLRPDARGMFVLTDRDGITHFNYFRSMIVIPSEPKMSIKTWADYVRRRIGRNIERFETKRGTNELSKWAWFRNAIDDTIGSLPSEIWTSRSV